MTDSLSHRGPDDGQVFTDAKSGLALGHRRLAVVELSSAGQQPMRSACGRYVLAYNGELYNHLSIRGRLAKEGMAPPWRGMSDTESLLAAMVGWGVHRALEASVGMFAFALWDDANKTLTLGRDRLGEKPLYFGTAKGAFVFASELKAIRCYPGFEGVIDRAALGLYLRHNCIPAPHTIYENLHKLMPGTTVTLRGPHEEVKPAAYWTLADVAERGRQNPFSGTDAQALDRLDSLLGDAVGGQMLADVPLGAFLSGGIDSSSVVALMQSRASQPVRTFTIGVDAASYDEAAEAKKVAAHLGTEHTELYVSPSDAMNVIPRLSVLYDEPFADSSQIPTFLVSQLARAEVTVALSGDGGDELFGGYNRHYWAPKIWRKIGAWPRPLRNAAAALISGLSPDRWDRLLAAGARMRPSLLAQRNAGDKLHKLAEALGARDRADLYTALVSHWKSPTALVGMEGESAVAALFAQPHPEPFEQRLMYLDTMTYLPDDILVKLDRAAMGVSLETRVPMLDHRLVEFAWQLPLHMKIRDGQGKWLLRQLLYRYVPRELVERPKAGFGVPLGDWLRGPLKDWAENLIGERRLVTEGYFDANAVRATWESHLNGRRNHAYRLWDVLMFQAWLEGTAADG